jgi:enoyl-CoA hydratase/carnithine racemase
MDILYEKRERVAYVTINRPEVMNAFNDECLKRLDEVWQDIERDPNIWVGVLTGAGDKAFSAGHDLKEDVEKHAEESYTKSLSIYLQSMGHLEDISKPMIAAINGFCVGGGFILALLCDLRIASETASFGAVDPRVGLHVGYGSLRLPRQIPLAIALEILLVCEKISAQEAYRVGLVNRVVPQDKLMLTAEDWAKKICKNAPLALRINKELVYRGMDLTREQGLRHSAALAHITYDSEDAREGLRAYAEKRIPQFKGR